MRSAASGWSGGSCVEAVGSAPGVGWKPDGRWLEQLPSGRFLAACCECELLFCTCQSDCALELRAATGLGKILRVTRPSAVVLAGPPGQRRLYCVRAEAF